jgi:hypothetical protein
MATVTDTRKKAKLLTDKAVRERYPHQKDQTWTGPTSIDFELRTSRILKDVLQLGSAIKFHQDGLCDSVLPHGDGPMIPRTKPPQPSPYIWNVPTQRKVKTKKEEGVLITVRELESVTQGER